MNVQSQGIELAQGNPVSPANFIKALERVQQSLDLAAVMRRYGAELTERSDGNHKATCVLPSLVSGFAGTCAEQDGGKSNVKVYETDVAGYWRWHCYSCKRGGDVVDFVAHREGWPLNEYRNASLKALRHAAIWAGCSHLLDGREHEAGQDDPMDDLLTDAASVPRVRVVPEPVDAPLAHAFNLHAAQFYIAQLGDDVRDHLHARGVTDEQITRWGIGYAPRGTRPNASCALKAQIDPSKHDFAERAGLLFMTKRGQRIDRQVERIVFPYCVPAGAAFVVTGFAGRRWDETSPYPKWVHGSNVPGVWEKGAALLGLWQAAEQARALGRLTICEGAFDALALERVGVPAVALVGASVTPKHAEVIARLGVTRVTLALDGDVHGRAMVVSAAASLVELGFSLDCIDVVDCDDGLDPATTDPATLRARWDSPTSAADYLTACGRPLPKPQRERAAAQRRLAGLCEELEAQKHIAWSTADEFRVLFRRGEELRKAIATVRQGLDQ